MSTHSKDALTKALNRAKVGLMDRKNAVFITTILFNLKQSWDSTRPTASTNGLDLKINPDWFMEELTEDERIGLLAHEAWHVAFQHMIRLGDRDPERWNQAGDHVINLLLLAAGFKLPAGGLWDPQYKDMSTEQVYDLLEQNPQDQAPNFQMDIEIGGDGGDGDGEGNAPGMTPEQQAELEHRITDILVKATTQSKMSGDAPGTVPGEISVMLDKLLNPKLPWNVILANYMNGLAKDDYSFRRPNRRFMPDHYLPSLYSEGLDDIGVAFDISCSVSDEEFAAEASEVQHIKNKLDPEWVTLVEFDTRIQGVHKLGRDDSVLDIEFHGRGGTSLFPVIEFFDKQPPKVLIVFSDLECAPIREAPKYPIIWICINNPHAEVNVGKLIHMEVK